MTYLTLALVLSAFTYLQYPGPGKKRLSEVSEPIYACLGDCGMQNTHQFVVPGKRNQIVTYQVNTAQNTLTGTSKPVFIIKVNSRASVVRMETDHFNFNAMAGSRIKIVAFLPEPENRSVNIKGKFRYWIAKHKVRYYQFH